METFERHRPKASGRARVAHAWTMVSKHVRFVTSIGVGTSVRASHAEKPLGDASFSRVACSKSVNIGAAMSYNYRLFRTTSGLSPFDGYEVEPGRLNSKEERVHAIIHFEHSIFLHGCFKRVCRRWHVVTPG